MRKPGRKNLLDFRPSIGQTRQEGGVPSSCLSSAPLKTRLRIELRHYTRFVLERLARKEAVSESEVIERAILNYVQTLKISAYETHDWIRAFREKYKKWFD